MELKRISSLWTFTHKFVAPGLFVLGFLRMLVFGVGFSGPDFRNDADFYLASFFFTAIVVWLGWRLKWVAIDENNQRLYVSNYRKEIAIPFSEIANVTEFFLSDP